MQTNPRTERVRNGADCRIMRKRLRLSLKELADRADVGYAYLSGYENGRISPGPAWEQRVTRALVQRLDELATSTSA
jgi:transcriptional regulator with XRE-family HTH domain